MKATRRWLQYLAAVSLVLLAGSGIYDIAAGLRASNWYLRWYEERYGAMAVSSAIFTYGLGLFRGTVTLGCGAIGLLQAARGKINVWYLLLLGICTSWYVRSLLHCAYRGFSAEDWIQMVIAVICFAIMSMYKCVSWKRQMRSGEA